MHVYDLRCAGCKQTHPEKQVFPVDIRQLQSGSGSSALHPVPCQSVIPVVILSLCMSCLCSRKEHNLLSHISMTFQGGRDGVIRNKDVKTFLQLSLNLEEINVWLPLNEPLNILTT
jgi:hypothetical protein